MLVDDWFTDEDLTASSASTSELAFSVLRNDAVAFVSQSLSRGRKNFWQLTTSRISVLLSCSAVRSASTFQFLKNYEDINFFILVGEGFCGVEAFEFRQRLKSVCESYVSAFHHQNIYVSHIDTLSPIYFFAPSSLCLIMERVKCVFVLWFFNAY